MSKQTTKAAPRGSDADKAARATGGSALPPDRIGDAATNTEKTKAANEKSTEKPVLNEPGKVEDLAGGAGALPGSLQPAADNAAKAERASNLQAELAKKPENPNDVYRKALHDIFDHVGREKAGPILAQHFGTSDPDKVGVHNLSIAIDELHKAAGEAE